MTKVPHCRSCYSWDCGRVLDLGSQPLANNLLRPSDVGKDEPHFPLELTLCRRCWLLQIGETVPPTTLFENYPYFSSFSQTMLRHARDAALSYIGCFRLGAESLVVE